MTSLRQLPLVARVGEFAIYLDAEAEPRVRYLLLGLGFLKAYGYLSSAVRHARRLASAA